MIFSRITSKQAEKYVPYDEDFNNLPPTHYTFTPSQDPRYPGSKGWETVTYYTGREVNLYSNREGEGDSWIYAMSSPANPGMLKIGSTSKELEVRRRQLSRGTGVPQEFEVEFGFWCFNALACEVEVHRALKSCRINNKKEFFRISLYEAIKVIEKIGEKYK